MSLLALARQVFSSTVPPRLNRCAKLTPGHARRLITSRHAIASTAISELPAVPPFRQALCQGDAKHLVTRAGARIAAGSAFRWAIAHGANSLAHAPAAGNAHAYTTAIPAVCRRARRHGALHLGASQRPRRSAAHTCAAFLPRIRRLTGLRLDCQQGQMDARPG